MFFNDTATTEIYTLSLHDALSDLPRKKKPSQVAQAETPNPWNLASDGRPSHLAWAPVATTRASQLQVSPESQVRRNGRCPSSTATTWSETMRVPTCSACRRICSMSQGPWMTSAKPG